MLIQQGEEQLEPQLLNASAFGKVKPNDAIAIASENTAYFMVEVKVTLKKKAPVRGRKAVTQKSG